MREHSMRPVRLAVNRPGEGLRFHRHDAKHGPKHEQGERSQLLGHREFLPRGQFAAAGMIAQSADLVHWFPARPAPILWI